MSEHNITVQGGSSVRLMTAGKYCDRDIVVTAVGGDSDGLTEALITRSITGYSNENITHIGYRAFEHCYDLLTIHIPNVETIEMAAFSQCSKLHSIDVTRLKTLGTNGFTNCSNMLSIDAPALETAGMGSFQNCFVLRQVKFPLLKKIAKQLFAYCYQLKSVDLTACESIASLAFYVCDSLTALILRRETMVVLENIDALSNADHYVGVVDGRYNPNGDKDGYIYVPSALVASYQADANWSTFATQFRALEDYTVDGTITGELDESKI